MEDRLFGLDIQLLFDACVFIVVILIMYVIMSKLFYEPVRTFLQKRQEKIDGDKEESEKFQAEAALLKAEYEEKLDSVYKEVEELLSLSRKAALYEQDQMVNEAKEKASQIMETAQHEVMLEQQRIQGDVHKEMSQLAIAFAQPFVDKVDEGQSEVLLQEVLEGMGDKVWLN